MLACTPGARTSWTARTTTVIETGCVRSLMLLALTAGAFAQAAGVRDHTRMTTPSATAVSSGQAIDLTLTLSAVAMRPIQTWVRAGATLDAAGRLLRASVSAPDANVLMVGQRARAFPLASRSSMNQARITRLTRTAQQAAIELALPGKAQHLDPDYLLEIVVDRGEFLSIANEAIIEEDGKRIVYVPDGTGSYQQRSIEIGLQGELYTQVLKGLAAGEQVVTIGSFFVDAEYKMKSGY